MKSCGIFEKKRLQTSTLSSPWLFFILAYSLSWLFELPAALLEMPEHAYLSTVLRYLGGLMLLVTAVFLVYLTEGKEGRRDYWQRIIDYKRIGLKWYAVIFLTVPLLTGLAAFSDFLLGGRGIQLEAAGRFLEQPLAIVPFALFLLLFGPLPEEIAWRGYALDRLQSNRNALKSSLILGTVWTFWHMPLFFIEGTYQHGLGLGTPGFWLFMLDKIPQSFLMTWIYNNSRRSTLSAILFHFMVNFTGELFEFTARAEIYYILFLIIAAAAVTIIWGPETLSRKNESKFLAETPIRNPDSKS